MTAAAHTHDIILTFGEYPSVRRFIKNGKTVNRAAFNIIKKSSMFEPFNLPLIMPLLRILICEPFIKSHPILIKGLA